MDEIRVIRRRPRRRKRRIFPWFLGIYALVILIGIGFGLNYLNSYLQGYELSLPYNATDAYMESLTTAHICENASSILDQIDVSVQTKEEALEIIKSSLAEPIKFYKRVKECTDTKLVYSLRCGLQNIGSFEMEQTGENKDGFNGWEVTKEGFDFSFLLNDGFTLTVPHDATVKINGRILSDANITESGIRHDFLKDFYDEFDLPTMTTYKVGQHLGELTIEVTDANGKPIDPNAEPSIFLDTCTDEEKADLALISESFITDYIHFTSQTNNDVHGNLARLCKHIVSGGALEQRMRDAVRGLNWVTDRNASIQSITVNRCIAAAVGKYICDITYVVNTRDITGEIQSESSLFVVFTQTGSGLKAESMISQ